MGTTANGFWYPDRNTPIAGLHTLLAQMQNSAESARDSLKAELTQPLGLVSIYSTGTAQTLPANTPTQLNGNSNGWQVGWDTRKEVQAAGLVVTTGPTTTPLSVTAAGTYILSFQVTHDVNASLANRSFTEIVISGTVNAVRRTIWTTDHIVSALQIFQVTAGTTGFGLQTYCTREVTITYAEMALWKLR